MELLCGIALMLVIAAAILIDGLSSKGPSRPTRPTYRYVPKQATNYHVPLFSADDPIVKADRAAWEAAQRADDDDDDDDPFWHDHDDDDPWDDDDRV